MHWDGDWHDGPGWFWGVTMIVAMVVLWGAVVWLIARVLSDAGTRRAVGSDAPPGAPPTRPSAEEILHERLARGELDPEEYRARLEALAAGRRT